jgi:hypothetical protein
MTPQHTAQYGQFERVSVVFEVFRARAWATKGWTSSPSATALAPAIEQIKSLRETCIVLPQQNPRGMRIIGSKISNKFRKTEPVKNASALNLFPKPHLLKRPDFPDWG